MKEGKVLKIIAKGAGIVFIGIIVSKIFGFLFRIVAARAGTEEYGLFALSLAIYGFLIYISALGFNQGLLRFGSYYKGEGNLSKLKEIFSNIFKVNLIVSLLLAFLLFFLSDFIAINIFHNQDLSLLLKVIAIAIPFDVLRRAMYSLSKVFSKVQYEIYSKNLVENLVKVVLSLVLLFLGFKALGIVVAYSASIVISFIVIFFLVQKNIFSLFRNSLKKIKIDRDVLVFSLPLVLTELMILATLYMDTLLLGFFRTTSEVGIYNAAVPLAQLLYVFPNMVLVLFLPVLSELLAKNENEIFKLTYKRIAKWIFSFNIMVLVLFIIFSKQILNVLFGVDYVDGYLALVILSIGSFVYFYALTSYNVLLALKKSKPVLVLALIGLIVGLILNLILIPTYGITGAALATSIQFTLGGILLVYFSKRITNINPLQSSYFKIILSLIPGTLITWFFVKTTELHGLLSLIIGGIIIGISYFLMLVLTKSFEKEDKEVFFSIVKKIRSKIG